MAGRETEQCGSHTGIGAGPRGSLDQCFEWARDYCPTRHGFYNFIYKPQEGGFCYCLSNDVQADGTCNTQQGWFGSSGRSYSTYMMYGTFRSKADTVCQGKPIDIFIFAFSLI